VLSPGLGFFQLIGCSRFRRALRLHHAAQEERGCNYRAEFCRCAHFSFSIAIKR
jgi:hypothetical protein